MSTLPAPIFVILLCSGRKCKVENKRTLVECVRPYYRKIYYDDREKWDKLALGYMNSCKKILDIGCGNGRFIELDPQRILGVDRKSESLKICEEKGYNIKYAEATELPNQSPTPWPLRTTLALVLGLLIVPVCPPKKI